MTDQSVLVRFSASRHSSPLRQGMFNVKGHHLERKFSSNGVFRLEKSSRSGEIAAKGYKESVDGGIGFPAALIQLVNCFLQPAQTLFVFRTNDLLKNLDQFVEQFDRLSPQDWALK